VSRRTTSGTTSPSWVGVRCAQVYAAPIVFERNAYEVPVFTRVHDFMWSGAHSARAIRVLRCDAGNELSCAASCPA